MEPPLPLASSSTDHISFHFPNINLSSPTPPPADKNDYFDQFPASHPQKPARPLHQKAHSETAMRLELPHSFPSTSHLSQSPMLRKKSGEVVRSSLKLVPNPPGVSRSTSYASTRSAPSTPVSGPKAVHFDSHLEHVRHFLSQQRPMAVSRDGSPIETETEGEEEYPFPDMGYTPDGIRRDLSHRTKLIIELVNMPLAERPPMKVCLKSIELAPDGKNLQGTVQVENIHFEKRVAARFTFDKWQTVSEVTADYLSSGRPSSKLDDRKSVDLFGFTIKLQDVLARIEDREMEIAVRYRAAGDEFWDNNSNSNYHIRFKHLRINNHPPTAQQSSTRQNDPSQQVTNSSQKPLSTPTTNETCPWAVTLRAELDRLVGDDLGISSMTKGNGIKKKFQNSTTGSSELDGLSTVTRLKSSTGLSARYDFSSSLKQATSNLKQQSNRSNRFELSLPFPVSPVPIEWLGVMPINSESPNRRTSTNGCHTPLEIPPPSTDLQSSNINLENHRSTSCKRWTIPTVGHLPNFPPSPPQESPKSNHFHIERQSQPTNDEKSKREDNDHRNGDGENKKTGSKLIEPNQVRVNKKHDQVVKSSKPKSKSIIEKHQHQSPFLPFHPQCASGLVTPQSPTLTDDST